MNIQHSRNSNKYQPTFHARNIEIRKADDICRRINRELPVLSNTRVESFMHHVNDANSKKVKRYLSDLVTECRMYYMVGCSGFREKLKLLAGIKKIRAGNCGELADATRTVFMANGYKDADVCSLVAFEPKTGHIRDLDHSVTVINLDIPKDYRYLHSCMESQIIKPNNKAILCDTWAGFTDYCKSGLNRYKSDILLSEKIKEGDELCFIPMKKYGYNSEELEYVKQKYPELSVDEVKENKDIINTPRYQITEAPDDIVDNVRVRNKMKKTLHKQDMQPNSKNHEDSFFNNILAFLEGFFFNL